jgi:hypothetical protein
MQGLSLKTNRMHGRFRLRTNSISWTPLVFFALIPTLVMGAPRDNHLHPSYSEHGGLKHKYEQLKREKELGKPSVDEGDVEIMPDFLHAHRFVEAEMHVFDDEDRHFNDEGGCSLGGPHEDLNIGGCIMGGMHARGRRDQIERYLCDHDTKEVYISHCRTDDCSADCTNPVKNHYGYKNGKCRFGNIIIKCTTKAWSACEHGHSKHYLGRHVCGDEEHEKRVLSAQNSIVQKHPDRHKRHGIMNRMTLEHIHHAEYHAHPHDDL